MDLFLSMTVYVKVVEAGSMTAAAQQCSMSTTMVGNHLRALEQRLGVSLLKRSTRRQSLTEFGSTYYQRCIEVLGLVGASDRMAEQALGVPSGLLRITAPPAFGVESLAPAMSGFVQRFPSVKLDIELTNQVLDLIDGGFDAAIRLGTLESSGLIARRLRDYTVTICASADYLQRRGTPVIPQDLQTHDCLAFAYPAGDEWRSHAKQWSLKGAQGDVVVPVSGPLAINSTPGLRQAAIAGMGLVMMPDLMVRQDLQEGRLIAVLQDYQLPRRPMHLVYAHDRYRLPKLRSFVDYAMEMWGHDG